jgi:hypothetical protein
VGPTCQDGRKKQAEAVLALIYYYYYIYIYMVIYDVGYADNLVVDNIETK